MAFNLIMRRLLSDSLVGGVYIMDTMDKGMIPALSGMEQDGTKFHHTIDNGI